MHHFPYPDVTTVGEWLSFALVYIPSHFINSILCFSDRCSLSSVSFLALLDVYLFIVMDLSISYHPTLGVENVSFISALFTIYL